MSFVNDMEKIYGQCLHSRFFWIGACTLLSLGIVWNMSQVFYTEPVMMLPSKPTALKINREAILEAPFFGAASVSAHHIQDSHLLVNVVGVLYAADEKKAQVIVQSEAGFDHLYRVGETIQPGVVILSIEPNGMIISNQGKKERLSLPENVLRFDKLSNPLLMKE